MKSTYRVYVLRNPQGRLYIGLTEDIVIRVAQHNAGESKWTAKYRPWILAWQSEELDLSAVRKLENLLKRQKGGDGLYRLTGLSRLDSSGS
jgi:predicted GIY-YIG superfamily endonuclease